MAHLDFLLYLVERELAEGIKTGTDKNNVLVAFDAFKPVDGVVQRVEEVGLRKTGNAQLVEPCHQRILILGEVNQNVRMHVVGDGRNPVILLEGAGKNVRTFYRLIFDRPPRVGKLNQHDRCNRRLFDLEIADGLWGTVLQYTEILFLQVRNELPVFGCHHDRDGHEWDVHVDGVVGYALDSFGLLGWTGRWFLTLFWNRIRAGVAVWTSCLWRDFLLVGVLRIRSSGRLLR